MWRCIEQLVSQFRIRRTSRVAARLHTTRLAIETLESRTVLSASVGLDLEALAYRDFTFSPPPRIVAFYGSSVATLPNVEAWMTPPLSEAQVAVGATGGVVYAMLTEGHRGLPSKDRHFDAVIGGLLSNRSQLGGNVAYDADETIPENKISEGAGSSNSTPQLGKSTIPAVDNAGINDHAQNLLADGFNRPQLPQFPRAPTLIERIVENQQTETSLLLPPMYAPTGADELENVDAASLLANYATLAALIDNDESTAITHDAAFEGYTSSQEDAEREEYVRSLAENQTRDGANESHGYVDLDEASVAGGEGTSNLLGETQRETIESAIRSLAARRGNGRSTAFLDDWLQQASLSADAVQTADAIIEQIANEPGGMILLQPLTDGVDELIVAGDVHNVVQAVVEMEATMGSFQAFDVSIDEASTAMVKPAPTHEFGVKHDREETPSDGAAERRAASGFGFAALGAMALAAKRQINDRRRKPR